MQPDHSSKNLPTLESALLVIMMSEFVIGPWLYHTSKAHKLCSFRSSNKRERVESSNSLYSPSVHTFHVLWIMSKDDLQRMEKGKTGVRKKRYLTDPLGHWQYLLHNTLPLCDWLTSSWLIKIGSFLILDTIFVQTLTTVLYTKLWESSPLYSPVSILKLIHMSTLSFSIARTFKVFVFPSQ